MNNDLPIIPLSKRLMLCETDHLYGGRSVIEIDLLTICLIQNAIGM